LRRVNAVHHQPADLVVALEHGHLMSHAIGCCAAAIPAGPLPTMATRLPVRFAGASGTIQPSAQPRSTIARSMLLIVTGSA